MKDKIKQYFLIVVLICAQLVMVDKVLLGDTATNYTSQQIANWLFGNDFSYTTGSGIYQAADSTIRVSMISSGSGFTFNTTPVVDTTTWLISDTTGVTAYVNDTLRFHNHYGARYKFSVTADKILTIQRLGATDSTRIPANGSFSTDYLNPTKDTTWVLRGGAGTTYYMGSQGR